MSLIRCITGSESLREGSAAMIVTLAPTPTFPLPENKGLFISEAADQGRHVSIQQRKIFLPASNNGVSEQGCYWEGNYNVPDGMILRVYARRQTRVGSRPYREEGVLFIRVREDAALQRLQLRRIESPQSTGAPVVIEGRFDILSIREVGAAKAPLQGVDLQLGKADKVRSVLVHTEVSPARRAPARANIEVVRTHDGEEVTVVSTRTKRATIL